MIITLQRAFDYYWCSYEILVGFFKIYIFFMLFFAILPAILTVEFGIEQVYMHLLDHFFRRINQTCSRSFSVRSNSSIYSKEFCKRKFRLTDVGYFISSGISAIVEDDITKRFRKENLDVCNLLARSATIPSNSGIALSVFWYIGMVFRYVFLFPARFFIATYAFLILAAGRFAFPCIQSGPSKISLATHFSNYACKIICRAFGIYPTFHNRENQAQSGICVSNHTTPIDALILTSDGPFRLTGQLQPGFMGLIEGFLDHLGHVFFDRNAFQDRNIVLNRLRHQANEPSLPPILIFPEGTCINNTCVMMFRKGSFEYSDSVYPVSIKYQPIYGNAFWDSSHEGMVKYLFGLTTSWMIVCDVKYLPCVKRMPNETSAEMAHRVQCLIAESCGVETLTWDGNLKRTPVPESLKRRTQKEFVDSLIINSTEDNE